MTRSQMIETVARKTGFTEAQVETTMDALFDQIADCLRADEKVTIAGFGRVEMSGVYLYPRFQGQWPFQAEA